MNLKNLIFSRAKENIIWHWSLPLIHMNLCQILMTWMHSSTRKFRHKRGEMFGRNHTKYYQTLLKWTKFWIKKILKRLLTPMMSLSVLRYVSLINNVEKWQPGSPIVWIKTKVIPEGVNNPHFIQIKSYTRFHYPMAKRKSWQRMLFLKTCFPR